MKIVLIAGSGLVLAIVAMVIVGLLLPKRHAASRRAVYRATPEQLYALISGNQSWRPQVARFESVTDSHGRELQKETDRRGRTITYEITDAVPLQGLKRQIAGRDLPYSGTWTYALQPLEGMTEVRITEDGEVGNPVFRFVSRFIIGHTYTIDQYLEALGRATGQADVNITN